MRAKKDLHRKSKLISSKDGNITHHQDGRPKPYQINSRDSKNSRTRPAFATKKEAIAELKLNKQRLTAKKGFVAKGNNTTFKAVTQILIERNKTEVGKGAQDFSVSKANVINKDFGHYPMQFFLDDKLATVRAWFVEKSKAGRAKGTLQGDRSVFSMVFKTAVEEGILAYSPMSEHKLTVPRNARGPRSRPLAFDDMTTLVRAVLLRTKQDRSELTFRVRRMMVMLAMFTGMRNEECSALFWDCVDASENCIHVQRIWRDGEGIVDTTKTGEGGKRPIWISPILSMELQSYRAFLQQLGMPTTGAIPVLVAGKAAIIKPEAISGQHWPTIASKAGFVDGADDRIFTFYNLRHTAATIWRTVGMEPDDLQDLMGHADYKTTVAKYIKRSKFLYPGISRDVHKIIVGLGVRTPEAIIDALAIVLAHRWRDAGIDIGCADPRVVAQELENHGSFPALSAPAVLDLVALPAPAPAPVILRSVKKVREWQRVEAVRLFTVEGWSQTRICMHLEIDKTTFRDYMRHANVPDRGGRLSKEKRQDVRDQFRELRAQHPEWTTYQFADALGVHSKRLTKWAREDEAPLPHRTYSYKLEKHEQLVRRSLAEKKSLNQIADAINRLATSEAEKVTPTGVRWFTRKLGLTTTYEGNGVAKVDQYDAEIVRMVDEGKDGKAISKVLPVSHSAICRRIEKLGLVVKASGTGHRIGGRYDATIREGLAEGKNGRQIAHQLSIDHSAVCRRINALGLKRTGSGTRLTARAAAQKS